MIPFRQVSIFGLGLMGASLAAAPDWLHSFLAIGLPVGLGFPSPLKYYFAGSAQYER